MTACTSCGSHVAEGPCPHCGAARSPVVRPSAAVLLLGLTLGAFQCDPMKGEEPPYGVPTTESGDTGDTGATTPE